MTEAIDKFLGTGPKTVTPVQEIPDAPEEGTEPEGNQPEHPDGNEGGSTPETGDSDSDAKGGKAQTSVFKRKKRK